MESSIRLLKKRSHDKAISKRNSKATMVAGASLTTGKSLREKENSNKDTYIKVPLDSYTYLSGLENQVDVLEDKVSMLQDRVNDLTDDLYAADLEITAKDALLKQHEKVATETVSELENATAETLALKNQLESSTVLKVTAEDRVLHLDTALKESMKQIKTLKEENDQKLHELALNKTEKWEKINEGLEAQIADLNHRLLQSDSERAALSRLLQEQSNMLTEINEQKSQVEIDNELLKRDIQSYENEISLLKYDLRVVTKDSEVQKEEKNMGRRSAEASTNQQLEDVKKMTKLEAECQRLRNLVRSKLPVPAALTHMKKGTGNTKHIFVEPTPRKPPVPGRSSESPLLMEKEIKMLKEALVTRDIELQSSRDMCAKMAGKFKSLEVQIGALNQKINSWQSTVEISSEGCVILNANSSCSAPSISEDENSDMLQATVPVFEMEILDDFIEMERLACSANKETSAVRKSAKRHDSNMVQMMFLNTLSKISSTLESQAKDTDMRKALDDLVHVMQGLESSLLWNLLSISRNEFHPNDLTYNIDASSQNIIKIEQRDSSSILVNKPDSDTENSTNHVLVAVVSRIHQLVLSADRKVMQAQESGRNIERKDLTASTDSFLLNKIILADFFLDLSHVLVQACELNFKKRIKIQLHEKEQLVVDLKSKLAESQKELKVTTENLENMLQEEKRDHQESLIRYMNLKDKLQRNKICSICSSSRSGSKNRSNKSQKLAALWA